MKIVICDIDGTIADCGHRLGLVKWDADTRNAEACTKENFIPNWDEFYNKIPQDAPILNMISLIRATSAGGVQVMFFTDRPESTRRATYDWLIKYVGKAFAEAPLYMRADGDRRPGAEVKADLFADIASQKQNIIAAFDDDAAAVGMWRAKGVPCFHIINGGF